MIVEHDSRLIRIIGIQKEIAQIHPLLKTLYPIAFVDRDHLKPNDFEYFVWQK